jgi:hypothetical protein
MKREGLRVVLVHSLLKVKKTLLERTPNVHKEYLKQQTTTNNQTKINSLDGRRKQVTHKDTKGI